MSTMTAAPAVRGSRSNGLYDVLELILDKGLVIDAFVRVSLVGIELLTVDARIVVASVDTYLRFAEAANRLDLQASTNSEGIPQLVEDVASGGASQKTKGALSGAKEAFSDWFGGDDENDDDDERRPARRQSNGDREHRREQRQQRRSQRDGDRETASSRDR